MNPQRFPIQTKLIATLSTSFNTVTMPHAQCAISIDMRNKEVDVVGLEKGAGVVAKVF